LSYEDAAATIGISVGALKSRLFRARETLRSRLGEERSGKP
ncbi:MAG TPA: sigma factor-like helix-turn-helix DNA-binding protein, partial [Candidatus Eisenbacteria bacterium]|nr:sigma factor-like helix-turn-helix DNA-binding protein [Candidatus Eisenbacteria bacterium]